MFADVQVMQAL